MYACPNCGRNIKFDITSQSLLCEACSSSFSPYDVIKKEDAVKDTYRTNVYMCPSCGGEIRTDSDNEVTSVCMYCGGSTIISSRISDEKKVDYIIPFSVTKEECNALYANKLRRNIFAPSEVRRKIKADGFRGIYMPYWIYSITQQGEFALDGSREYYEDGKYVSANYTIEGELDASYVGVSFDASSSFPDNMSQTIAPYDMAGLEEFTPSFLSGFYADASDTPEEIYHADAINLVSEKTLECIGEETMPVKVAIKEGEDVGKELNSVCDSYKSAMFPVWFMSFKHHGRMSYSVINGQTGDLYADIPISIRKYLLGSLIIFIPIFLALNMFTLTPQILCFLTGIFTFLTILLYNKEAQILYLKENNLDDKGYCYHNGMPLPKRRMKKTRKDKKALIKGWMPVIFSVIWSLGVIILGILFVTSYAMIESRIYGFIFPILSLVFYIIGQIKYDKGIAPTLLSTLVSVVTGVFLFVNPVYDMWFYTVAIAGIASVIFNVFCLIRVYNRLATRPMPQFRRGGDDDAV